MTIGVPCKTPSKSVCLHGYTLSQHYQPTTNPNHVLAKSKSPKVDKSDVPTTEMQRMKERIKRYEFSRLSDYTTVSEYILKTWPERAFRPQAL
jgi:hypothetical protein